MNEQFYNLINSLSLIVGMQNLQENREQSAHNDVQLANDNQAKYLLEQLNIRFDEIIGLLKEIKEKLDDT